MTRPDVILGTRATSRCSPGGSTLADTATANHPSNFDFLGRDSKSELAGYTPIQYKNIDDDASVFSNDGAYLREPSRAICLVVGGTPFHVTPHEYAALGSPPFVAVEDDT